MWIKPLQGVFHDSHLALTAPNSFVASWVKDRLLSDIAAIASEIMEKQVTVSVGLQKHCKPAPLTPTLESTPDLCQKELALPLQYHAETIPTYKWRHSLEDFVVGPCNELAYAACNSLCNKAFPSEQLFLSSAPGLGKTHLAQGIGNLLNKKEKALRVGYLTGEEFGNQMIMSLKARKIDEFKGKFRNCLDILLLEDIHFFQGKPKMQEELLSTLKSLQESGKKVVFTSSFLPKELDKVDSQLTSQFCSGFLAMIKGPDYTMRIRIINAKARSLQVQIPEQVSDYVAKNIQCDIRQLESCIQSLAFKAKLLRQKISMNMAREVLAHYIEKTAGLNLAKISQFICDSFELPEEKLKSKSRHQNVVTARNTAFYLARMHTELSLKDIGNHFNRRHSTVVKGISNVEREIRRETSTGRQLKRIIDQITN